MAIRIKAIRLVFVLAVLAAFTRQAPVAVARKQKPAAARNTTFPSCNSGTSRLAMANLDKLPQQCRPAHKPAAAAVHACFETVRIRVNNCQLLVHPTARTAKQSPICKLMYVRGALQGPSNASLVAVFNQARFDRFLQDHPDMLKNTNASSLQRALTSTLVQLYGRTITVQGKGKCSAATGASPRTKVKQDRQGDGGGVNSHSAAASGVGAAAGKQQGHKSGAAAAAEADTAAADKPSHKTPTTNQSTKAVGIADASAGNTNATRSNSSVLSQASSSKAAAGPHNDTASSAQSSHTSSNLGNTSSSNSTNVMAMGSSAALDTTGHRRLLLGYLQRRRQGGRRLLRRSATTTTIAAGATDVPAAAAMPDSSTGHCSSGSSGRMLLVAAAAAGDVCTEEQEAQEAEEEFKLAATDSSSIMGNAGGAVLYLQGSKSIVLQPNSMCKFEYIVTRNPSVLQPASRSVARGTAGDRRGVEVAAGAAAVSGAAAPGVAWLVYSSISVMLGVLVIYMAVKLLARRNDTRYDPLGTTEAAAGSAVNGGGVQMVPTAGSANEVGQHRLSSMGTKQNASSVSSEPGDTYNSEDRSRLVKNSSRSEGGATYGRGVLR